MLKDLLPSEFQLSQNYPNPFRDRTTIKYCVPHRCRVVLSIHRSNGRPVERLVDTEKEAGTHEAVWDAEVLSPGVYLCRMKAASFRDAKKMLLKR